MGSARVRSVVIEGWEANDTQVHFRDGWVPTEAPTLMHKGFPAQVEIYRGGKVHAYERPIPQPFWTWSYRCEAEHFVECVRTGVPFRSSGEDTLADVRLFEEIYRVYLQQRRALCVCQGWQSERRIDCCTLPEQERRVLRPVPWGTLSDPDVSLMKLDNQDR